MNVRLLTQDDHHDIINLFGDKIGDYYFIVDEIIRNKFNSDNLKVYGEYDDHELVSILLNNYNNVTYYSSIERNVNSYIELLSSLEFSKITGISDLVEKFIPYVKVAEDAKSYMGVVKGIKVKRKYSGLNINLIKSKDEIGKLYELFRITKEYQGILADEKDNYVESVYNAIKNGKDRIVCLYEGNKMVASCATTREDRNSAIVVGVVTNPYFRGKGYGTEVLISLLEQLLDEGIYPYLFYNNPKARSVYKNLGMKEVSEWRVLNVKSM